MEAPNYTVRHKLNRDLLLAAKDGSALANVLPQLQNDFSGFVSNAIRLQDRELRSAMVGVTKSAAPEQMQITAMEYLRVFHVHSLDASWHEDCDSVPATIGDARENVYRMRMKADRPPRIDKWNLGRHHDVTCTDTEGLFSSAYQKGFCVVMSVPGGVPLHFLFKTDVGSRQLLLNLAAGEIFVPDEKLIDALRARSNRWKPEKVKPGRHVHVTANEIEQEIGAEKMALRFVRPIYQNPKVLQLREQLLDELM
ncbi:hypothetical protein KBD59_05325 [Candidatus Gracilibacteria bacterium]|nr:hypothetical protein [Candidatus Gracilibacteria bacterium]